MKKIVALALVILTLALALVSCGKEIIGVIPKYVGEPIVEFDENHEFKKEDFSVMVIYKLEQGQETTDDFTIEVVEYNEYYYTVAITHKGWTEYAFVDIGAPSEEVEE